MKIKQGNRTPWEGEFLLPFRDVKGQEYSKKIKILDTLGDGSSCICYDVLVEQGEKDKHRRILKQFYPIPTRFGVDIETEGTKIKIHGFQQEQAMKNLAQDFEHAYEIQCNLSNQEELMDVVVYPIEAYFQEETKYVLYEANYGYSMEKYHPKDAMEILKAVYEILMALEKLHQHGILHMDLKPANILWINQQRIKFFDFDASINMKEMDHLTYIKGDEDIRLLAPELRNLNHSIYDVRDYLKPRVDVYSVAAMLFYWFLGRYPEDEDNASFAAGDELTRVFNETYRGFFSEAEQEYLKQIIYKGITDTCTVSHRRKRTSRYQTAREMAEDIRILMEAVAAGGKEGKGDYRTINYRLITSYVMNEYPLDPYRYMDQQGQYCLDVVLAGDSPIRDEFFKNIFACAQMTDTTMKIRFLSKGAENYWKVLNLACPELCRTAEVYMNGIKISEPLDTNIVEKPLAELYFYTDEESEICQYAAEWMNGQEQGPRYYLLAGNDHDQNYQLAQKLAEQYTAYADPKLFVAFHDLRDQKNQLRRIQTDNEQQKIRSFGGNEHYTLEENNMKSEIAQMALGIHTYYTKGYWERASKEEISHDFRSSQYNVRSSIRAALGIRYKFVSCGIQPDMEGRSRRYYDRILAPKPGNQTRFERLIALEHRCWTAFMILEGYRRPEWDQVEAYMYRGKNDHRDKWNKYHPCMWASKENTELRLKDLPKNEWKKQLKQLDQFDQLDQMSLRLHELCRQRAEQMDLDNLFQNLKKEVELHLEDKELLYLYRWLRKTAERMIGDEPNINHIWNQVCRVFQAKIKKLLQENVVQWEVLKRELEMVMQEMRVVEEHNRYHDYKGSDEDILKAIPRLLMEKPYRRIYKPVSEHNWENVMSALILEPEELVLITEESLEEEMKQMQAFCRHRGLGTQIQKKRLSETRVFKGSKRGILDITGLDPEEVREYQNNRKFASMDWCIYTKEGLKSYQGSGDVEFYEQKKTISVEESLMLSDASIHDQESIGSMLKLKEDYKILWEAFAQIPNEEWCVFSDFLHQQSGWRVSEKAKEACTQSWHIWKRLCRDLQLTDFLLECQEAGIVEQYKMEEEYEEYLLTVTSRNHKILEILQRMIDLALAEPYEHAFHVKKAGSEIYIIEEGLHFHGTLAEAAEPAAVEHCLKILEASIMKDGKGRGIIQCLGEDPAQVEFRYVSQPVQKVLQQENGILKTYVYHKIWEEGMLDDFKWNTSEASEEEKEGLDYVDLIGRKGNETIFISCVTRMPSPLQLSELALCALQHGINGRAVIVGSFPENAALKKKCRQRNIQYYSCK